MIKSKVCRCIEPKRLKVHSSNFSSRYFVPQRGSQLNLLSKLKAV